MKTFVSTLALIALATVAVAQGGGMDRNAMMKRMGPGISMQAADADGNREVTAAEWSGFTKSITSQDGTIELANVQSAILGKALDANKNGKFEKADLEQAFKTLDKDSDGAVSTEEMSPRRGGMRRPRGGEGEDGERPRRRGGEGEGGERRRRGGEGGQGGEGGKGGEGEGRGRGREGSGQGGGQGRERARRNRGSMVGRFAVRAVLGAADADQSRSITAEEWKSFLAKFEADEETGTIDSAKVTAELMKERKQPEGDEFGGMRRRFSLGSMLGLTTFDADEDGKLAQADFDKMFADLDKDADQVVTGEEMRPRRGGRRGGRGGDGKDV